MERTVEPGDEMTDADIDEHMQELREWREDAELKQSQLVERYAVALRQIAAMKYEADPQAPRIAREALDGF